MKTFLCKTLLLGLAVLFCLLVLLWLLPLDKENYLMAYNKKCRLLEEVPSPRIVFVGGSNLCFGLDSERIADTLGMPVINYALHAGIGLKFMADDIACRVGKGDVVVFAPEYEHFYTTMNGAPSTIAPLMMYSGWKKWNMLDWAQKLQVLRGVGDMISEKIFALRPKTEQTYQLSGFNAYGDESRHWEFQSQPIACPAPFSDEFDVAFAAYFIRRVEEMGKSATVVLLPPVICESAYRVMKPYAEDIARYLSDARHPFAVSPSEYVLPDSCAYDTCYHMNKLGVTRHTSHVIATLRPIVQPSAD